MSWLYRIIPASWSVCPWYLAVPWALFGNDADGICGERSGVPGYQGAPVTFRNFGRWWTRNPMANLMALVLSRRIQRGYALLGTPQDALRPFWPANVPGALLAWNGGPLFAWELAGWEGYIGMRPRDIPGRGLCGVPGLALRRGRD